MNGLGLAGVLAFAAATDPSVGGSRYVTSHAQHRPIARAALDYSDTPPIKEYHFHVYFHLFDAATACPGCNSSYIAAERMRRDLVAAVRSKRFVAVCHGVTDAILPGLNTSNVPHVNMVPTGPHPAGSYEVWAPREYLADLLSFMLIRREELTILLHPLTEYAVEDHTGRATFFGPPMRINLNALSDGGDPAQYPELGLGYSAMNWPTAARA